MEEDRVIITKFLQWNDKNGSYTDENCDLEAIPRMTYEDSIRYFFIVINEDVYCNISKDVFDLPHNDIMGYAKEFGFYDKTINKLNILLKEGRLSYKKIV